MNDSEVAAAAAADVARLLLRADGLRSVVALARERLARRGDGPLADDDPASEIAADGMWAWNPDLPMGRP